MLNGDHDLVGLKAAHFSLVFLAPTYWTSTCTEEITCNNNGPLHAMFSGFKQCSLDRPFFPLYKTPLFPYLLSLQEK